MGCRPNSERILGYCFEKYGQSIGQRPLPFLLLPLLCTMIVAPGLFWMVYDDDIVMIFTPYNAPSRREQQIARQFSHTAPPENDSAHFALPLSSPDPYTDIWFNLQVTSKGNLMTQHSWTLISQLVNYIYENFTCQVNEWPDEEVGIENSTHLYSSKNSTSRQLYYGRDFCNRNRGCIQVNEMVNNLVNLLNVTKYGHNKNVRLTYPVMYVWGRPFNWGQYIFGVKYDRESGVIESAKLANLYFHFQVNAASTQAQRAAQSCVRALTDFTLNWHTAHPEVDAAGLKFFPLNEPFVADQVNQINEIIAPFLTVAILLILGFIAATSFNRRHPCISLVGACMGLFTVGLSLLASFGFLCLCGIHMNFVVTVTPFLVLCVGIDNDFLITSAWRKTLDGHSSVPTRLGRTFADCGPNLTITSVNDILCFGIGYLSATPAVADFCLHTCVALVFRFLFQMTFFAAVIAYVGYREERSKRGKNGWLFKLFKTQPIAAVTAVPKKSFPNIVNYAETFQGEQLQRQHQRIHDFFHNQYASFLMRRSVRATALLLYTVYLVAAVIGAATWVVDISPKRLFYDDSPIQVAVTDSQRYIDNQAIIGRVYVTAPPDFRSKSQVNRFMQFVQELENADDLLLNISQNYTPTTVDRTDLWLRHYMDFLQYFIQQDEEGGNNDFQPDFYDYLTEFLDSSDYGRFVNDLRFKKDPNNTREYKLDKFQFVVSYFRTPEFPYSYDDDVKVMLRWRKICAEYNDYDAVVYDGGQMNPYFDQKLTLAPTCLQTMGIALLTVSIVTVLMMPDLRSMFFICLSFLSVDVGVIAGLNYWNCDLDPTSVAFVLMTIGFSVYYTARVCYCYQSGGSSRTSEEKMRHTMDTVGWPILQGALATMIGVLPDVFLRCYTVRVFYRTVLLVVVIGLVHGLVAMPVLMSAFDKKDSPLSSIRRRLRKRGRGHVTPPSADTLSECSSS